MQRGNNHNNRAAWYLQESQDQILVACASLLSRLMAQPLHGPRVRLLLSHLLPEGLVAAVADGPAEAATAAFAETAETPETLWTRDMAATTAEELDALASAARQQQVVFPAVLQITAWISYNQ
jgi:DnaJ family protein C protein 13